jgi:threonine aldolase
MPNEDMEQYRWSCRRALFANGNRTAAQLLAEIPTDLGLDRYGAGGAVAALEGEICNVLGKPAAVFMPSGTMAQQIAIRIYAERSGVHSFAFHPTCHLHVHEEQAHAHLHGLKGVPIGQAHRLINLDDLRAMERPMATVLIELPQREIGGVLPSWSELEAQTAFVRANGIALHLDGARLWECSPYYERTPAQIAALFDSVYVSLYKGLGGLAGCCLAGDAELIAQARLWRRRHGGTLYSMWPNAASGLAALRKRLPRMRTYYEHALAIAAALGRVPNVQVLPNPPQTPMMHMHVRVNEEAFRAAALRLARDQGIWSWTSPDPSATPGMAKLELAVGDATLEFTAAEVADFVAQLVASD